MSKIDSTKLNELPRTILDNGSKYLAKYENNYGASIVRSSYSYGGKDGLFELAVLKYKGDDCNLCYTTPITDNVIGWLDTQEVGDLLEKIKAL